jgi:cytochrome c-type biogenesis protein CcmE
MKNKTPQKNTGFKNSLYLGIFIIIILAAAISMVAVNIYRYIDPYKPKSEIVQEEEQTRDTIYLPSPPKEIRIHDTIWRTRPVNKVKAEEVKDSL